MGPALKPVFKVTRQRRDHDRGSDEAAALTRVSAAAADAYRLEDVMEQAAEAAREVTGAASLSISRWERESDTMRTLINVGALGDGEDRLPLDETYRLADYPLASRLLREGKPYCVAVDDHDAPPVEIELLRELGKESAVAVSIVLDGSVWGEVWATTAPGQRRFDDGDIRFLEAIADRLALVLSRAERYTRVSRLAYEDPLTGLANRRAIEERLDVALRKAVPGRGPVTLLLCDVDGLKDINDRHGHYVGDRALCRVADALVTATASISTAFVGRLAGDEFCVLLEGCDHETASDVASNVLTLLAAEVEIPLSLSFGAAAAVAGMGPSDLLRAADQAQYTAKRRGGGRLCTADPDSLSDALAGPRSTPGRSPEARLERTSAALLAVLDADLAGSPALDRIEAVAGAFSGALNAGAWAISTWTPGSEKIRTVSTADDRASRLHGTRVELEHVTYLLADYQQTAELVRSGNGACALRADDSDCDAAERALLGDLGFSAALMLATSDGTQTYLLEIYADSHSAELEPAMVRAQMLLRIAATAAASS
jgi:diguanylate cyclase (GGDEF)-like protein